ncbi:MAG: hypothetical protein ACRCXT_14570 [Paraclostridium sp.]
MSMKKRATKSIAIALVGLSIISIPISSNADEKTTGDVMPKNYDIENNKNLEIIDQEEIRKEAYKLLEKYGYIIPDDNDIKTIDNSNIDIEFDTLEEFEMFLSESMEELKDESTVIEEITLDDDGNVIESVFVDENGNVIEDMKTDTILSTRGTDSHTFTKDSTQ